MTFNSINNKNSLTSQRITTINFNFFDFNRFHFYILLCWQFGIFFAAQMVFPIFSNYLPKWKCNLINSTTINNDFTRNCSIFKQCPEDLIEFEENIQFHSAAMEYRWICGAQAYKQALFSQAQFSGVLIGTLTFGAISDTFGRKIVSLIVLTVGILSMFATVFFKAFSPNWHFLLASRLILGLCLGGNLVVVYTFVMEHLLPKQRMAIRGFINWVIKIKFDLQKYNLWPNGTDVLSYYPKITIFKIQIRNWSFIINLESPTWLHSKGRLEQMRINERKIARLAGLPPSINLPQHEQLSAKESSVWNLIRDKALFKRVIVLWVMFTAAVSGYSIDLNSSNISGDFYFNQCLLSLLCAFSKICLVLVDTIFPKFSRRNLHQYSQFIVIISASLLIILVYFGHDGIGIFLANLIGLTFIELTWDACYLWFVESVPTTLRASSVGSCSLIARIGTLIAPALVFVNTFWSLSVYLVIVLLGLFNLLISWLFLYETKGINLDAVHLHNNEIKNNKNLIKKNMEMEILKIEEKN
ncbi:MFS domain-containing protein [Meloidogyne graminicola]|uniref:MFS domain-containing protein n=1 Tax=Meloidogyne graminicola TaxID=189291 RepID=A0A8S9Z9G2_9BILA|nr:MFS domain-containing protein [Meloidogyne graminicola]